jgi:hypothetical protein
VVRPRGAVCGGAWQVLFAAGGWPARALAGAMDASDARAPPWYDGQHCDGHRCAELPGPSSAQSSDGDALLHAAGPQSDPASSHASGAHASAHDHASLGSASEHEDGCLRDRGGGAEGGRHRPGGPVRKVSFSDSDEVFDVVKLGFRDLRGDTRDLSSTCEDPDWCSLGLARSHKLAAFAETFILRKSFCVWDAGGGPHSEVAARGAPPSRGAAGCEIEDGSASSSCERVSSSDGDSATGTRAGGARTSASVRARGRGARAGAGRGRGAGRGNAAPPSVDTDTDSPHSSPQHAPATPYYLLAAYNPPSPFLPALPPSPSMLPVPVLAGRCISDDEDTWSDWDSNSISDCSSMRNSLDQPR